MPAVCIPFGGPALLTNLVAIVYVRNASFFPEVGKGDGLSTKRFNHGPSAVGRLYVWLLNVMNVVYRPECVTERLGAMARTLKT